MTYSNDRHVPRWFLVLVFSIAGTAGVAWASWVSYTCLTLQGVPAQIHEISQDVKWLIKHGMIKNSKGVDE